MALRTLLFAVIGAANMPAFGRGGSPGEGGGQLFIGLILVVGVGYLLTKIPTDTLKSIGGLILVFSALAFLFNVLSGKF